jgi:hypothetical protein
MSDAVSAAIEAAKNAANTAAPLPAAASAPAAYAPPAAPLGGGRVRSLTEMAETHVERPDLYVKVDFYGLHIEDAGIIPELKGTIDLKEAKFPLVCRYTVAGQAQYLRTYDGVREVKSGKPWAVAVEEVKRSDPKADVYDAAEFVMTLTEQPTKTGNFKDPAPVVGQRVGHTSSRTGFDPVMKFLKEAMGIHGATATVPAKITATSKEKGSNKWGVLAIELLGN